MAVLAAQTQEAFFQAAALQVRIELLLDVIRQRPTCFGSKRTKGGIVLLHRPIQQSSFGAMAGVARRVEKRRRTCRRARLTADTAGVPAAGGDATDYGATGSGGLPNPDVFEQKCWTKSVYGSRDSVTVSDSCRRNVNRVSSFARFFPESPRCIYLRASTQ